MTDVLQSLDTNHDGVLTASEKAQAKIILYGHSWGASEVASFARGLKQHGVPVLLTVQIDIVRKPGQEPTHIPPNVKAAVNLFQSEGLLRGRSEIAAEDPERTEIIGNFRMTYDRRHVDCRNYPLLPRTINKPHHEIENEPVPHRAEAEDLPSAEYAAPHVCGNADVNAQVREALRLVCDHPISEMTPSSSSGLIVIGFLGGFVKAHESKHPEVWFLASRQTAQRLLLPIPLYPTIFDDRAIAKPLTDAWDTSHLAVESPIRKLSRSNVRVAGDPLGKLEIQVVIFKVE